MNRDSLIYRILKSLHGAFYVTRKELCSITDPLLGYYWEKRRFLKRQGYPLNLKAPRTFNEKVIWKKLFDRNPLLPITGDKYSLRGYVEQCLGKERAAEYLVPLLYATDDPKTIPFDTLPPDYIVKISYGSGWNIVVRNHDTQPTTIIKACTDWLKLPYGRYKYEWAYGKMKRMVVVEELLKDDHGNIPKDYKFHMFHGECAMIQVDYERYEDHSRSLFDEHWNLIPAAYIFKRGPWEEKPASFDRMLALSKELSRDFDFVRVDLYTLGDRLYVGELTHYPGAGMEPFRPNDIDIRMGDMWTVRKNYWLSGKAV
jgi:hypothetical protein